jgi:nucleoid-associated protein YgaU
MVDKKKNIIDRAIDAVSNRDEKAAAEAAKEKAMKDGVALRAKLAAEKAVANEKVAAAARVAAQKAAEDKAIADKLAAEKAAVIKHVWKVTDTYAALAFEHYGSIKEPYWRLIYNHNKAIIGNNPNDIRVGLEIEIPPLPEELKKK